MFMISLVFTHGDGNGGEETPASCPPVFVAVPGRETAGVRDHDLNISEESTYSVHVRY